MGVLPGTGLCTLHTVTEPFGFDLNSGRREREREAGSRFCELLEALQLQRAVEIFDIYPFRICTLLGTVPIRYRVEHSYQIRAESSGLLCRRAAPLCQFYVDKTWEPSARRKSKG